MTWLLVIIMVGAHGDVATTSQMVTERQCRAVLTMQAQSTGQHHVFCVSPEGATLK